MPSRRNVLLALFALLLLPASASADSAVPLVFDPSGRSAWRPEGCRSVPAGNDIIATHGLWRMLHLDIAASDEVSIALAPVFEREWDAETGAASWKGDPGVGRTPSQLALKGGQEGHTSVARPPSNPKS